MPLEFFLLHQSSRSLLVEVDQVTSNRDEGKHRSGIENHLILRNSPRFYVKPDILVDGGPRVGRRLHWHICGIAPGQTDLVFCSGEKNTIELEFTVVVHGLANHQAAQVLNHKPLPGGNRRHIGPAHCVSGGRTGLATLIRCAPWLVDVLH